MCCETTAYDGRDLNECEGPPWVWYSTDCELSLRAYRACYQHVNSSRRDTCTALEVLTALSSVRADRLCPTCSARRSRRFAAALREYIAAHPYTAPRCGGG
jgi:hypothetical protein